DCFAMVEHRGLLLSFSLCSFIALLAHPYMLFVFHDPATPEIYPLSLHDALPISWPPRNSTLPSPTRASSASSPSRVATSDGVRVDRKSTRLNSSHVKISYAVFCLKKKKTHRSKDENGLVCLEARRSEQTFEASQQ